MKNFIIEGDAKKVVDLIMKASKIVSLDVTTWCLIQLVHGPNEGEIG